MPTPSLRFRWRNTPGSNRDPWYGEITIAMERDALVLRFNHTPGLVADVEHWQYDTFKTRWRARSLDADAFVTSRSTLMARSAR